MGKTKGNTGAIFFGGGGGGVGWEQFFNTPKTGGRIKLIINKCFYPHVWSLVEGPKSVYTPSLSSNHIAKSWLPR